MCAIHRLVFLLFLIEILKKMENALHTMSPGLTFLPFFLPSFHFIYLKIVNKQFMHPNYIQYVK